MNLLWAVASLVWFFLDVRKAYPAHDDRLHKRLLLRRRGRNHIHKVLRRESRVLQRALSDCFQSILSLSLLIHLAWLLKERDHQVLSGVRPTLVEAYADHAVLDVPHLLQEQRLARCLVHW